MPSFLHVGAGFRNPKKIPPYFRAWKEVRLDVDAACEPDICCSMTDMSPVPPASFDAVYSSHSLEHLYAHEVPLALREFRRVLNDRGVALITLPDLQAVAAFVAQGKYEEPVYLSPSGPVSPADILYGMRPAIAAGHTYMAHRSGFVRESLARALFAAGFAKATILRKTLNLWALAFVAPVTEEEMARGERLMLPLDDAVYSET